MTKSNERAKRGKTAEKVVEKLFNEWNTKSDFAWHRLPDARSAGGRLKAQPADYLFWKSEIGGFLEVKESSHDFRLAKDKISQLPTLHKFRYAGARSFVLILHTGLNLWRVAPVTFFDQGVPSWDLSGLMVYPSAEEALCSTGVF